MVYLVKMVSKNGDFPWLVALEQCFIEDKHDDLPKNGDFPVSYESVFPEGLVDQPLWVSHEVRRLHSILSS